MNNQYELLRLFIKDSPLALAMLDNDLIYIACSDKWLLDYGLKYDPVGHHHYDVFPEISEEWKSIHKRCLKGHEERKEEDLFVRLDGTRQWLRWAVKPWRKENNEVGGILFYTEDITKSKEAEFLSKKHLGIYQTLIQNMNEGVILINPVGDILEMNPAALSILEVANNGSVKQNLSQLFAHVIGADNKRVDFLDFIFVEGQVSRNVLNNKTLGVKTSSGSLKWLNLSSQLVKELDSVAVYGIFLMFHDITERQQIERKLYLEREKFEIAANAAGLGFWEWSLHNNQIKWDDRTAKIYGCAPNEVITTEDWTGKIAQNDRAYFLKSLQMIKETGVDLNIEIEIIHPQGRRFLRLFARLQNSTTGAHSIYGVHYDFTLRKQAELALIENESRLSNLLENTEDVLYVYEANAKRFSFVSSSVYNLTGIKADEWMNNTPDFGRLIYHHDLELVFSTMETSKSPQVELEFRIIKQNSTNPVWVLNKSKVVELNNRTLVFGLLVNIQNKKEAEFRELQEKTKLEGIIRATRVGTWQWFIEDNRMDYNARWAEMLGYKLDELQPTTPDTWRSLIHPDDLPKAMELVKSCFTGEIEYYDFECRLKHKDGSWIWVQDKGQIVKRDLNGNPLLMLGTHLDITERKRQEQERLENLELLTLQNQRLRSFAYIVSHNLRSHSSNITMLIDLIKAELDPKTDLLNLLEVSSNRLAETLEHLNSVLNVTNTQNRPKSIVNLASVIEEVLKVTYFELQMANAEIFTSLDENLHIKGYRDYVENMIHQFVENAIKFKSEFRNLKIEIKVSQQDQQVCLEFSDNGSGIDMEKQKNKIFGMYQVFHKKPNVRGLGLFLLKNQVEAMDGTIIVESEVEKGTTFKMYFDIA